MIATRLRKHKRALNASLDPNLAEVVRNATRLAQRAKVEQLQATIAKKEKRIEKLNAQRQLLPLQISKGQRRVDRATKTAQLWEARATQRRQEQAAAEAKAAEQQAQAALNYPEPIKDVFALKAELSKTFDADSNPEAPDAQIGIINNQIQEAAGNLSELKSKIAFTLNRGRIAEQSTAYGLSLRSELNSLPNKSELLASGAPCNPESLQQNTNVLTCRRCRANTRIQRQPSTVLLQLPEEIISSPKTN